METLTGFFEAVERNEVAEIAGSLFKLLTAWRASHSEVTQGSAIQTTFSKPAAFLTYDIDGLSTGAAEAWVKLSRGTQEGLLRSIRSATSVDPSMVIANVFGTFTNLASLPLALANIQRSNRKILKNQEAALKELKKIEVAVVGISRQLDEGILRRARKGLFHLVAGANSDVETVRAQQLLLASSDFSSMIALDSRSTTRGTSGEASNVDLAILGYWGNHLCFGLQNDQKNALAQVYECTRRFKVPGLRYFDPEYFFRPYMDELDALAVRRQEGKRAIEHMEWQNRSAKIDYWMLKFGSYFMRRGRELREFNNAMGPLTSDTEPLRDQQAQIEKEESDILMALDQDCAARLDILRTLNLEDLKSLSFKGM